MRRSSAAQWLSRALIADLRSASVLRIARSFTRTARNQPSKSEHSALLLSVTFSVLPSIMYMLFADWKYTLRSLWKDRAFTATVVLTLAVGIGANTAIFSIIDGVLLRPLDYPEPDRLVSVTQTSPKVLSALADISLNIAQMIEWRRQAKSIEGIALFRGSSFGLTGAGQPELISGAIVSANIFRVLGIGPRDRKSVV